METVAKNKRRVERMFRVMRRYCEGGTNYDEAVVDLLADLLHFVSVKVSGVDGATTYVRDKLRIAVDHYSVESRELLQDGC